MTDQQTELEHEIAYKNNPNLKQAGAKIEFTEHQIREIKKCSEDIEYFAKNYVKVIHPDHGFLPFIPYDYQSDYLKLLQNNNRVAINFCRQSGKCCEKTTNINIRNKKTGEIIEVSMEEFYNMIKQN